MIASSEKEFDHVITIKLLVVRPYRLFPVDNSLINSFLSCSFSSEVVLYNYILQLCSFNYGFYACELFVTETSIKGTVDPT